MLNADVTTPQSTDTVDVVVTATVEFRVSRRDSLRVDALIRPQGGDRSTMEKMRPGPFFVQSPSPGRDTTSSFTWIEREVPASGETYRFDLEAWPYDGPDPRQAASASGDNVTFIIEMWPSD